MKRFLYFALLLISTLFIAMQTAFASDIDDILKNLESPEVDYHVDSEIKTIVVPQSEFYPAIKPDLRTKYKIPNANTTKTAPAKKSTNQQKDNKTEQTTKTVQKQGNKAETPKDKKNNENQIKTSDSKDNINKASTKAISKNETTKEAPKTSDTKIASKTGDKKQSPKISDKKSKPIKVYSLFLFFKDMKVVKNWVSGINENLEFFKSFSNTILVFWQQKVEEEEEEDEEEDEEGEEGEEEEEEKKTDFSKYASIITKGEDLYSNRNWDDLQKLVDENPDASEAPAMQKFLLMLELNKKKPNLNQVRSYADNIISEEPNNPEANYGLAYFYFYNTKKRNTNEASKHIKIATQGKNPLKEAVKLSNEISKAKMIKIVTIVLISIIVLSIIGFVLIKKLRAKKKAKTDNVTNQQTTEEVSSNTESSAETIVQDSQKATASAETTNTNEAANNVIVEEIIEEVVEDNQSGTLTDYSSNEPIKNASNINNDNQVIVEEVIEEVEEQPETPNEEIVEEIIEEVEEEPGEEIVEEVIEEVEEVEEEPEEEIIEEIIEEVEDDEDDYSDDIDSISEEALLTE